MEWNSSEGSELAVEFKLSKRYEHWSAASSLGGNCIWPEAIASWALKLNQDIKITPEIPATKALWKII